MLNWVILSCVVSFLAILSIAGNLSALNSSLGKITNPHNFEAKWVSAP